MVGGEGRWTSFSCQILVKMQLFFGWWCALTRPQIWSCSLSSLSPCGGGEELVCAARDEVPADVLEMAMAFAVETRCLFSSSLLQWRMEWRFTADRRPWLETKHCARLAPDGLLCIFFVFWGCLCKSVGTAVVVVSRGVCACHVSCMS